MPNSVVSAPTLEVKGRSSPDATVSVNGNLTIRASEGVFSLALDLDEGPNLVEVIATDLASGYEEVVLMVIYAP